MRIAWEALSGRSGHAVGRQLLQDLYRQETGEAIPPILKTKQGKPYFPGESLYFSISHTKNHAFCCLSRKNVGVDAEEMDREISLALAKKWLSPAELARLEAAGDPRDCLLRLWVLKESYAKLTGRGLGNYLAHTDFSPEDPALQIIDGCYVAVLEE